MRSFNQNLDESFQATHAQRELPRSEIRNESNSTAAGGF
jgi:hypothetical protein